MNLLKSAHKKVILTFLFAIFIPSIIVGYLSFNVFYKHRQSVERLLNSTLWSSGENALETVENTLIKYEERILEPYNFRYLIQDETVETINKNWGASLKNFHGKLFIINSDYQIICPLAGSEKEMEYSDLKKTPANDYQKQIQKAEFFEFIEKDYVQAVSQYQKCQSIAISPEQISRALEGKGRCLLASKHFEETEQVYHKLANQFGYVHNNAGHPYGIVAVLQLFELAQQKQEQGRDLGLLLELYKDIQNGRWQLRRATYDFFTTEIESILNSQQNLEGSLEILSLFNNLQQKPAVYKNILNFTSLLERRIIPSIKERLDLSPKDYNSNTGRIHAMNNIDPYLVSYKILPNLKDNRTFYGGFYWDLDSIKYKIIPYILDSLMQVSDFHFKNLYDTDPNLNVLKDGIISEGTLAISYRQFPIPGKLHITHPDIQDLKKSVLRENFYYGAIITLLAMLMIFGVVLIVRDISRESETTLLKTEFVNNISHELKTPLSLIRLFGETLQTKKNLSKQEIEDSYQIITKESERLSHLINNVLDFSKIEMGKKEFNFTKENLGKIVEETLESYRYHLEKKGFTIRKKIATELSEVRIDKEAIASILINLLSNAVKFSPDEKEVIVRLFSAEETIVLQVADKGIGITKKEIHKIFQRFYRSKNDLGPDSKGSGLGLALVKHITEAHRGRIEVESEPNRGSVFSIILPAVEPPEGFSK